MINSKKDFDKLTVWISLDIGYENPTEHVKNTYRLLNAVYRIEEDSRDDFDSNILKSLIEKMAKNISYLDDVDTILENTKEAFKPLLKNAPTADIITSAYVIPTTSFEITLSELEVMYRVLNYCLDYPLKISEHMYFPWQGKYYYSNILEIQEHLKSRLAYALFEQK